MARTKTLTEENTENVVESTEQEIVENKEISIEKCRSLTGIYYLTLFDSI